MSETVTELSNLSYTFFPKGLSDSSEKFWNSKEYKNQRKFLEQKGSFESMLNSINKSLLSKFDNLIIENLNDILPKDRCVKEKLILNKKSHCLVVYMSMLIPYYVIYESSQNFIQQTLKPSYNINHIEKNISKDYLAVSSEFNILITDKLPQYQPLSQEVIFTPVHNIAFNGNGVLENFIPSNFANPMTLFNVFFSDNYF